MVSVVKLWVTNSLFPWVWSSSLNTTFLREESLRRVCPREPACTGRLWTVYTLSPWWMRPSKWPSWLKVKCAVDSDWRESGKQHKHRTYNLISKLKQKDEEFRELRTIPKGHTGFAARNLKFHLRTYWFLRYEIETVTICQNLPAFRSSIRPVRLVNIAASKFKFLGKLQNLSPFVEQSASSLKLIMKWPCSELCRNFHFTRPVCSQLRDSPITRPEYTAATLFIDSFVCLWSFSSWTTATSVLGASTFSSLHRWTSIFNLQ